MTLEELKKQNTVLSEQVTALTEAKDKEVKALSDVVGTLKDEIATLKVENEKAQKAVELSAKEAQFNTLLSAGKVVPAQKEAFIAGDTVKFAELHGATNPAAKGSAEGGKENSTTELSDDQKFEKVVELAEKLVEKDGISMADALSAVRNDHPELK